MNARPAGFHPQRSETDSGSFPPAPRWSFSGLLPEAKSGRFSAADKSGKAALDGTAHRHGALSFPVAASADRRHSGPLCLPDTGDKPGLSGLPGGSSPATNWTITAFGLHGGQDFALRTTRFDICQCLVDPLEREDPVRHWAYFTRLDRGRDRNGASADRPMSIYDYLYCPAPTVGGCSRQHLNSAAHFSIGTTEAFAWLTAYRFTMSET